MNAFVLFKRFFSWMNQDPARLTRQEIIKGLPGTVLLAETFKISSRKARHFAKVSGDYNPIHLSDKFAREVRRLKLEGKIIHGMHPLALISGMIGMQFPKGTQVHCGAEKWLNYLYVGKPFRVDVILKEPGLCRNIVEALVYPHLPNGLLGPVAISAEFTVLVPKE